MTLDRSLGATLLVLASLVAACGEPPPAEQPPQPTVAPTAEAAPIVSAAVTAAPTATASAVATTPPPPAPKPAKERIVGKWQFSLEGEARTKLEDGFKKQFPKDDKKVAALMKVAEEEAAGEWVEFVDGFYVSHVTVKGKDGKPADKVILKVKYEVTKEDGSNLGVKAVGNDEISKKPAPYDAVVTLKDDSTLLMPDPKKGTLTFKRK